VSVLVGLKENPVNAELLKTEYKTVFLMIKTRF
jgi:hypothetical protein